MVEIAEVMEEATPAVAPAPADDGANAADARSQECLSDADEIEAAMSQISSPSARLHVEQLIARLRREGKSLQRVAKAQAATSSGDAAMDVDDKPADAPSIPQASLKDPPESIPKRTPAAPLKSANKYQSFPTYYFDAGSYNSEKVSVYVPLDGIGSHDKSKINCSFTESSFDLIVTGWEGKDYRLLNDNLEKDIDPSKSKCVIKPNKIILRLGKVKGEYGFESWQQLTAKKKKKKEDKNDPAAGIMDMMKDMYDSGDDNMKKMIGETMYKQRTGQLGKDGMGGMDPMMGMGGMGDMGL